MQLKKAKSIRPKLLLISCKDFCLPVSMPKLNELVPALFQVPPRETR